jgi:NADH-quinone oxidoreductase subunit I
MAIIIKRPEVSGARRWYVTEVLLGLFATARHVLRNLVRPWGLPVVSYPEQKKPLPPAARVRHRLMKRQDGTPRCTACMLCATSCPAECIHIIAGQSSDPNVEKFPERFDLDALRCVVCGLCVEACPLDALRMDVPVVSVVGYRREDFLYTKGFLMDHDNQDVVPDYNPPRPVEQTHGPHARP